MERRCIAGWLSLLTGVIVCASAASAAFTVTGSVYPSTIPVDGNVPNELQVGVSFQSTGQIDVTEGDILSTWNRTFVGYTIAASGTVNITDATWNAAGGMFVASAAYSDGVVHLDNATWNVDSNITVAKGDNSFGEVILDGGSTWDLLFRGDIADGENCVANVYLNDGEWIARAFVSVGGDQFNHSPGVGSIYIREYGTFNCTSGLEIRANSRVLMGGGLLSLAGDSTFTGALHSDPNVPNDPKYGGVVRVNLGEIAGGSGLVSVGPDVDFENINIELVFHPEVTPDPLSVYDAFDAIDSGDLPTILATADAIATPTDWTLDTATGELSFISIVDAVSGPDVSASAMRQTAYDSDGDTDVDLADVAFQQIAVGGLPS